MRDQWKPRHIIAIAFAVVLGVTLAPLGVAAATGNLVNITDPERASRMARVDTTGALRVGTGTDPLDVVGTVTANEARPSTYVRFVVDQHTGCNAGYTIPGGKALIITTITSFLHNAGVGDDTEGLLMTGTSGNCSTYVAAATSDTASTETVVQNIEPGLAVPAGLTVNGLGSNNNGSSHVYGYLVPASAVPAAAKAAAARISASSPTQADGS